MRAVPDDEFKLRFPVAKDRTLRRIAITRLTVGVLIPTSFISGGITANIDWKNLFDPVFWIFIVSVAVLLLGIPVVIIMNFIEGAVLTRRYGWRAVSDPIEAQRVAMREALYDVATGSTRPDVELGRDGDRIMVVPVRRLRPVGARLELIAEREKAQVPDDS